MGDRSLNGDSLDDWLRGVSLVLTQLTVSQQTLANQLREIRQATPDGVESRVATGAEVSRQEVNSDEPPRDGWPNPSDTDWVDSRKMTRNYNYFTELDQKLERLRQNGPDLADH